MSAPTLLKQRLGEALARLREQGVLSGDLPEVPLERPKRPEHGDFASNVALGLAKRAGIAPRALADQIVEALKAVEAAAPEPLVGTCEVAGPGFLNLRIADRFWHNTLGAILAAGRDFGRLAPKPGLRIDLEYVSANPTGPLHVGHGRGAAVGDALARLLKRAGYDVTREYYVNDAGNQVQMLTHSVWARYMEQARERDPGVPSVVFPENGYKGDYVRDLARALFEREGTRLVAPEPPTPGTEAHHAIRDFAVTTELAEIKRVLGKFRVEFDVFVSERELHESGKVTAGLDALVAAGHLYEKDKATWLRTTSLSGDDKDRVVRKSDGELTYMAADIANHKAKYDRGFSHLIDLFGADHHGYIQRMKAVAKALGHPPESLEILIIQLVRLLRGGEEYRMGKRSGEFVTLEDVLDEVGPDAARFFFLLRRHDSHVDFDVELAKKQSLDNPVFYVQYAHARCASLLRRAAELAFEPPAFDLATAARLTLPEELSILRRMAAFPALVDEAATAREPHRLINFATELAQEFQSYYTRLQKVHHDPVLPQERQRQEPGWREKWDAQKTAARLLWIDAIRVVLVATLDTLGIAAPDRMDRPDAHTPNDAETAEDDA
jgi:arginyl-tRNA synthetase